jgi:rare lipoprotein A
VKNKRRSFLTTLLCLLGILFLAGCGASFRPSQQDGPPKRIPKNIHKTPDAVPKVEPLSRHGNRYGKSNFHNSYVAHKKRHHVMKTSKGYKARGVASWYGTRFHGRKTANGEHYNMFSMTAAHKTLPLPTYVKVINLKNHKSVIVRVNDRGPFSDNRIIDLSYAAATKLGILGHGTAHVEVVSVDPRDHKNLPKHRHTPKSQYPKTVHGPQKPRAHPKAHKKIQKPPVQRR